MRTITRQILRILILVALMCGGAFLGLVLGEPTIASSHWEVVVGVSWGMSLGAATGLFFFVVTDPLHPKSR